MHEGSALKGAGCVHCYSFTVKQLCSRLALFGENDNQESAPHGAGPTAAETQRHLHLWDSQLDLADKLGVGLFLSQSSVASYVALEMILQVWSSDSSDTAENRLFGRSSSEGLNVTGFEANATSQTTSTSSLACGELLDVITPPPGSAWTGWQKCRNAVPAIVLINVF